MINWQRVDREGIPSPITATFPGARMWLGHVDDGVLRVFVTHEQLEVGGPFLKHLSISHGPPIEGGGESRYPTWDEQKEAVWKFAPGKRMISVIPPEDEFYVNLHETTFHWWEESR